MPSGWSRSGVRFRASDSKSLPSPGREPPEVVRRQLHGPRRRGPRGIERGDRVEPDADTAAHVERGDDTCEVAREWAELACADQPGPAEEVDSVGRLEPDAEFERNAESVGWQDVFEGIRKLNCKTLH
jgi:hypothetical protein